jgi:2-iminobutanoate/2-iminopropanoate deaminase
MSQSLEKSCCNLQSPFSPAVKTGHYIFVSGQTGCLDSKTNKQIIGIEGQVKQCMRNMEAALCNVGASLNDVVKVTVFLKESGDFPLMNEVYKEYFPENKPARSTVITGLINPQMLVEMECIACTKRD